MEDLSPTFIGRFSPNIFRIQSRMVPCNNMVKEPHLRSTFSTHVVHERLLPPANEVCEGYVFTGVCRFCPGGACVVALGGCVWLLWGACMVAPGGACMVALGGHVWLLWGGHVWLLQGGHAWLLPGGMHGCSRGHGCSQGVCMVALGGRVWFFRWVYGQWVGGTHPTGMHSCLWCKNFRCLPVSRGKMSKILNHTLI